MSKHRIMTSGLVAAASISMLAACSPTSTPTTPGTPSSSPTATATPVATPNPGETASPTPTGTPVATPTPGQTASPTPTPSATATATASPSGSPTSAPLPSATSDISVVERTTFNGKIFDDTQAPLDGVTVTAKSLNSSVPYEATSSSAGGSYAFNNAPAGVQLEITASKPGFTTRRRVEVLKSNKDGDPNANKYDFGSGAGSLGTTANALSDKPEVTVVTPGRNAAGVSPTTSFVLRFSEPMDRATVVDNFEIRTFTSEKLSVDTRTGLNPDFTVLGADGINSIETPANHTRIWDKAAFNVSWNSDDTEVTFSFREERMLPTDKDTDKIPDYQVLLTRQDNNIKDKSGITRSTTGAVGSNVNNGVGDGGVGAFKLTEGNFEMSYKFSISADTTRPSVESITAQTAENSGANSDGDAVRVRFSERMIHYTLGPTIAGGMGANTPTQAAAANNGTSAEAAAANYSVIVNRQGTVQQGQISWAALGGRAIFDTNDPTHRTVLLLPGIGAGARAATGAGGALVGAGTLTGTFSYTDGTTETVTATVSDGGDVGTGISTNEIATALNALEDGNNGFTVSPANDTDLVSGSTYTIALATGSQRNGRTISSAVFNGGTAANSGIGNGAAGQSATYQVFPGTAAGGRPDLYRPGDNVQVFVSTTVVDPAGNSIDSSGDDASANAS